MAFSDLSKWDKAQSSPVAPTGMRQVAQAAQGYASGDPRFANSRLGPKAQEYGLDGTAQSWYTGANQKSTKSGLDTKFYQSFMTGWNKALEDGTSAEYFSQPDATGIVMWDHKTKGADDEEEVERRFGDIVKDGETVGNVYDQFEKYDADLLMAQYVVPKEVRTDAFAESNREERLAEVVEKYRKEGIKNYESYLDQKEFAEEVEERKEGILGGIGTDIITALSAASGVALTAGAVGAAGGSFTGPGAIVSGGLATVGGFAFGLGAYMNRDALAEQAARGMEIYEISAETQNRLASLSTGVKELGQFSGRLISPVSNLVQGAYDVRAGTAGDGISEFYAVDEKTGERLAPMWVRGADVAGTVVDSALQFASPAGIMLYSGHMGATVTGGVGELTVGQGNRFNYRKAAVDSIWFDDDGKFDLLSGVAGVASVGIDAVQLGMGRGLARSADDSRLAVGRDGVYSPSLMQRAGSKLPLWMGGSRGLAQGQERVRQGGFSFTRDTATGAVTGQKRATLSLLAPSEHLTAIMAGTIARRQAAARGGAVSADDYYRALVDLSMGSRPARNAIVNAMGEGYEEFAQAILDPISEDDRIDWGQVGESALYGFAGGLGMSAATQFHAATADDKMFAQAVFGQMMRAETPITRSEWNRLSAPEKRTRAMLSKVDNAGFEAMSRKLSEDLATDALAGTPGMARFVDAMQSQMDQQLAKANPRVDGAFVITGMESFGRLDENGNLLPGELPAESVSSSGMQLLHNHVNKMRGVKVQLQSLRATEKQLTEELAADPESVDLQARLATVTGNIAHVSQVLDLGMALSTELEYYITGMYDDSRTAAEIDAGAAAVNDFLRRAFYMELDSFELSPEIDLSDPETKRALAQAASALFARDPHDSAGSYQMLLPQVSAKLTAANSDNVLQISNAILPSLRGDFDGDKIRPQNMLIFGKDQFENARSGQFYLGAGTGVNIAAPKWEAHNIRFLSQSLARTGVLKTYAADTLTRIGDTIRKRYADPNARIRISPDTLDRVLEDFYAAVRENDPKARSVLLDGLAGDEAGHQINQIARENLRNEWLWLDQLIVSSFQEFQDAYALHASSLERQIDTGSAKAHKRVPREQVRERAVEKGATFGSWMNQVIAGVDPFRQSQKLHYTAMTALVRSVENRDKLSQAELAELAGLYEAMGQALAQDEIDAVRSKDSVTARVVAQLQKFADNAQQLEPSLSRAEAMVVLANLSVVDIEVTEDGPRDTGRQVTLLQMLLKNSINIEEQIHRDVIELSPELQTKFANLRSMTRPGDGINAERAFVEVFGSQQLFALLGEASEALGPQLTLEQLVRIQTSQGTNARRLTKQSWRDNPNFIGRTSSRSMPYTLSEVSAGEVSAYHSLVSSAIAVSDHRVSYNPKTKKLGGEFGKRQAEVSKKFRDAFRQIREVLEQNLRLEQGETYEQGIARFFEENQTFAARVMQMIPNAAAAQVFRFRDGQLRMANWVHSMFAETSPERAEMVYYSNTVLSEWYASGVITAQQEEDGDTRRQPREFSSLNRRIHRIMYDLNPSIRKDGGALLRQFMEKLRNAGSMEEFIQWVNETPGVLGNQAPLVPWFDDTAEFDADKAMGGWTTNLQGAEQREAIANLAEASQQLSQKYSEEREAEVADRPVIRQLREDLKKIADGQPPSDLYHQFQAALDRADTLGMSLGPQAMMHQTLGAVIGLNAQSHTKGKNPPNVELVGQFEALRDAFDYVTNYERMLASLTSQNMQAVNNNMGQLSRGSARTMDEYGNPVAWEKPTVEQMLELWENPDTRAMVRSIMFPTVMERTVDGRLSQQLLVGKSLKDFLDGTSHRELYSQFENLSLDSALRYLSAVEAKSRKFGGDKPVMRAVNDLVIARVSAAKTTLSVQELTDMVTEAYYDFARSLQATSSLAIQPVTDDNGDPLTHENGAVRTDSQGQPLDIDSYDPLALLRKALTAEQRKIRTARALGLEPEDTEHAELLIQSLIKDREQQLAQDLAGAAAQDMEPADRDALVDMLESDFESFKARIEMLSAEDEVHRVTAMYAWPEDPAQQGPVKERIIAYISSNMQMLHQVPQAIDQINLLTTQLLDPSRNGQVDNTLDWDLLSRAVIASYIETSVSMGGVPVPVFPNADRVSDQKYYDASFSYLVDPLLDRKSPILLAALELQAEARRAPDKTEEDVVRVLRQSVLDDRRLGQWTADVVVASVEANKRLDSAAAAAAIAMSGNSPKRQAVISAATRRSYLQPEEDLLSTVELDWGAFGRDLFDMAMATRPSGRTSPVALIQLNNRFARSVTATLPDGTEVELLPQVGRSFLGNDEAAEAPYKEIHLERIKAAVLKLAEANKVRPEDVGITVSFFHPDDQPAGAQWANNLFFEGTSFRLDADRHESLNTTLWFANGALSPDGQAMALDASKKGLSALKVIPVADHDYVRGVEQRALRDLASVLRHKARDLMETDLGFGDRLDPEYFNAVYKDMKLRHFVRGRDENDNLVLWTAEQVISHQEANPGVEIPLEGAELWVPSDDVLRTMLGEQGTQGVANRFFPEFLEVDPTQVPIWTADSKAAEQAVVRLSMAGQGSLPITSTSLVSRSRMADFRLRAKLRPRDHAALDSQMETFSQMRHEIHQARANDLSSLTSRGLNPEENLKQAMASASAGLRSENLSMDWAAAGLPIFGARNPIDSASAQALLSQFNQAQESDGFRTGWVYEENMRDPQPSKGRLSHVSLSGTETALKVAPGDVVVFNTSSFAAANDPFELAKERIDYFRSRGAALVLISSDGRTDLRAELGAYLGSVNYEKTPGSKHLYQYVGYNNRYRNQQARGSALLAVEAVTPKNQVVNLLVQGMTVEENSAWVDFDDPRLQSIGVSVDLVPVNAYGNYNVPVPTRSADLTAVNNSQVLQAIARLKEMNTAEGRKFLVEMAHGHMKKEQRKKADKEFLEAWDRMMIRFNDNSGESVLPAPGDQFGLGDMIPLVSVTGDILLYRHGHKAPADLNVIAQMSAMVPPGQSDAAGIASYSAIREPQATVRTGRVVEFKPRSQFGLSVELDIPLQTLGAKVVLEGNGMKYVLTPRPDHVKLPETDLIEGWRPSLISSLDDAMSKEAFQGMVLDFRNAFAHFGIDFTDDVGRALFPNETNVGARNRAALKVLRDISTKMPDISVEAADALIRTPQMLQSMISSFDTYDIDLPSNFLSVLASDSNESRILRAMVAYLRTPGAKVEHVLRSGGFNAEGLDTDVSIRMPRLFTQFFDGLPLTDPLRAELFDRLNAQIPNGPDGTGYVLHDNFQLEVIPGDGRPPFMAVLQFSEMHDSGDNPVLNGMSFDEGGKQQFSEHSAKIAYQAVGVSTAISFDPARARALLDHSGLVETTTELTPDGKRVGTFDGTVWSQLTAIPAEDKTRIALYRSTTAAGEARQDLAAESVTQYRHELDTSDEHGWDDKLRKQYGDVTQEILVRLGLDSKMTRYVDFWVRQIMGAPLGEDMDGVMQGHLSGRAAVRAAEEILDNVSSNFLPVASGSMPGMNPYDLQAIYRAQQTRTDGRKWQPKTAMAEEAPTGSNWNSWVEIALGTMLTSDTIFDPLYLLALDGTMHMYQAATMSTTSLPVSLSPAVAEMLTDPETNRMLISIERGTDALAANPTVLETTQLQLANLLGGRRVAGRLRTERAPADEISRRRDKVRRWRKENGVPLPIDSTVRDLRKNGVQYAESGQNVNQLMRVLLDLRVAMALLNPLLFLSMGPEQWVRGSLDRIANLMEGRATQGTLARLTAAASDKLEEKRVRELEKFIDMPKTGEGIFANMYQTFLDMYEGVLESTGRVARYTTEEIDLLQNLYHGLGNNPSFVKLLYQDMDFIHPYGGTSRIARGVGAMARFGAITQDPTRGVAAATLARRYLEAALSALDTLQSRHNLTVETLVAHMKNDPHYLANHIPEAHKAGMQSVAQIRSLRHTLISKAFKGVIEPMADSERSHVNWMGNLLLKMPFIFATYGGNLTTSILGMQGVNDVIAMLLDGRKKGVIGRAQDALAGKPFNPERHGVFDLEDAIDGVDLARSYIRGGITHTGLFVSAMVAGSLNMGGEDEEAKRRRLLAENQGVPVIYDPLDPRNDWRNPTGMVFMDWLPFGFGKYTSEAGGEHSGWEPHWILKQFISPVIGIEGFMRTGEFEYVKAGFSDAVMSMPIVNTMALKDAVETSQMLEDMAHAKAMEGGDTSVIEAAGFLTKAVMAYERMLMESSFVNGLYVAFDEHDRDPYALPLRDSDGDLQRDIEGNPRPNDYSLQAYLDPETGIVEQGYRTRGARSAQLHSYTENRASLALMSSLFTGKFSESDFIRFNMPIKLRTQEKRPVTQEEAKAYIMAAFANEVDNYDIRSMSPEELQQMWVNQAKEAGERYDWEGLLQAGKIASEQGDPAMMSWINAAGEELMTLKGGKALFRGLTKGTTTLNDLSRQGIALPFEMRQEIEKEFTQDLIQEGIDMGLNESLAIKRMKRIWVGDYDQPEIPGLKDILWSNDISFSTKRIYKQYRTSYVTGPDGLPWGTGIDRSVLTAAFGLPGGDRMLLPKTGAMGIDENLNSTDLISGANTGLRGLELLNETEYLPTDKEIADSTVKAIEDALSKHYTPTQTKEDFKGRGYGYGRGGYGYSRRGYSRGGGGGYYSGGSSYFTRMNPLPEQRATYAIDVPFINTSNPILRRANVRRERVWSERGRLKQWQ